MKFDVVIGNPPYQDSGKPGDNALYQHFTKKVLDELLNDSGYFSFVLPTTMSDYLLLCEKNRNYIKNFYDIKSMVFDYPEEYFKNMGVGTTAFYFTIKNEIILNNIQNIEITYKDGSKRKTINRFVEKGEILPKKNFGKYEELVNTFLSKKDFGFKVMKTKSGKNRRIRKQQIEDGTVTLQRTEKNKYIIVDGITKSKGQHIFFYSEMMEDYDKNKVIFSKSGYPMATYVTNPMNLSDNMMYIVIDNEIVGKNIAYIINSKIFSEVISLFSTNARDAHKTVCKLKKVNLSEFLLNTEEEIFDVFRRGY